MASNVLILFNAQPNGSKYSNKTFRFAVVDELRYGRENNDYPRTIIVLTLDRGKVIMRSVRPEDCMLLKTEGHIGDISSEEIIELENQIHFPKMLKLFVNKFDTDKYAKYLTCFNHQYYIMSNILQFGHDNEHCFWNDGI